MSNFRKLSLLLILIITLACNSNLFSQDIINLVGGDIIIAKNIIIKPTHIDYLEFNKSDSNFHSLPKTNIVSITYKNGTEVELVSKYKPTNKLNLGKNLISFHLTDFVISNFTLSYERILGGGKYGIQIPVSFGYKDETSTIYIPIPGDVEYVNKLVSKFYSGINLNLYPTGQGRFKYFLGPAIHFGNGLYHEDYDNYSSTYIEPIKTEYVKLLLNNGITYTPVNSLSISLIGSIGIQHMFNKEIKRTETTGALSLNLSLRF